MAGKLSEHYGFFSQLAELVLDGQVFRQRKKIENIDEAVIKIVYNGVYNKTKLALASLAKYMPRITENLLLKVIPKSAAFISIIGYELLEQNKNIQGLIDTGTVMSLIQVVDHLMDRGDEKMLQALEKYFDNIPIHDLELQARVELIEHIVKITDHEFGYESFIVTESSLDVLRDEARVLRLSQQYKDISRPLDRMKFLEDNATKLAYLSIRNGGLRPATYMIYGNYLKAGYDLPSIIEIETSSEVNFATRLGEWAIRIWDDWGDQEIDAGHNIYTNSFVINVFLESHPHLTTAYLQDIIYSNYYQQVWNSIQEGHEGINHTLISILQEDFTSLKVNLDEGTRFYLEIMERIIEAGFVNHAGDEGITASEDVVADYSQAKSDQKLN